MEELEQGGVGVADQPQVDFSKLPDDLSQWSDEQLAAGVAAKQKQVEFPALPDDLSKWTDDQLLAGANAHRDWQQQQLAITRMQIDQESARFDDPANRSLRGFTATIRRPMTDIAYGVAKDRLASGQYSPDDLRTIALYEAEKQRDAAQPFAVKAAQTTLGIPGEVAAFTINKALGLGKIAFDSIAGRSAQLGQHPLSPEVLRGAAGDTAVMLGTFKGAGVLAEKIFPGAKTALQAGLKEAAMMPVAGEASEAVGKLLGIKTRYGPLTELFRGDGHLDEAALHTLGASLLGFGFGVSHGNPTMARRVEERVRQSVDEVYKAGGGKAQAAKAGLDTLQKELSFVEAAKEFQPPAAESTQPVGRAPVTETPAGNDFLDSILKNAEKVDKFGKPLQNAPESPQSPKASQDTEPLPAQPSEAPGARPAGSGEPTERQLTEQKSSETEVWRVPDYKNPAGSFDAAMKELVSGPRGRVWASRSKTTNDAYHAEGTVQFRMAGEFAGDGRDAMIEWGRPLLEHPGLREVRFNGSPDSPEFKRLAGVIEDANAMRAKAGLPPVEIAAAKAAEPAKPSIAAEHLDQIASSMFGLKRGKKESPEQFRARVEKIPGAKQLLDAAEAELSKPAPGPQVIRPDDPNAKSYLSPDAEPTTAEWKNPAEPLPAAGPPPGVVAGERLMIDGNEVQVWSRREGQGPKGVSIDEGKTWWRTIGEAQKAPKTFEEFKSQQEADLIAAGKYEPDQVGFRDATDRMAQRADNFPEWQKQLDAEADAPAPPKSLAELRADQQNLAKVEAAARAKYRDAVTKGRPQAEWAQLHREYKRVQEERGKLAALIERAELAEREAKPKEPAKPSEPEPVAPAVGRPGIGGGKVNIPMTEERQRLLNMVEAIGANRNKLIVRMGEKNAQKYLDLRAGGMETLPALARAMGWFEEAQKAAAPSVAPAEPLRLDATEFELSERAKAAKLTRQQQLVIQHRLDGRDGPDIGREFGVSKARIEQIEKSAMKAMGADFSIDQWRKAQKPGRAVSVPDEATAGGAVADAADIEQGKAIREWIKARPDIAEQIPGFEKMQLNALTKALNAIDAQKRAPAENAPPARGAPKTPEPGRVYEVPVGNILRDPERFQFKVSGIGEGGVTQELKGVKWNPDFAGVVSVWRDPANGKDYVVNGHHRHELAQSAGAKTLRVQYLAAPDAMMARAKGALINIAEGRGTAVDAAKFLRDTKSTVEDLANEGISLRGPVARDGVLLAKLSDALFNRVAQERMPVEQGLAIARELTDHSLQDQLLRIIDAQEAKGKDLSPKVIGEMARRIGQTATYTKEGTDLFGDFADEQSLFVPRAELTAHIRDQLGKFERDFRAVSSEKRAELVAGEGNVLNVERNKQVAEEAGRLRDIFDQFANLKGPLSDKLDSLAKELVDAKTQSQRRAVLEKAARSVQADLPGLVEGRPDGGGSGRAERAAGGSEVQEAKGGLAGLADRLIQEGGDVLKQAASGERPMSGFDPELATAFAKFTAGHLLKGTVTFAEFVKGAVLRFGEAVRPHLRAMWKQANQFADEARQTTKAPKSAEPSEGQPIGIKNVSAEQERAKADLPPFPPVDPVGHSFPELREQVMQIATAEPARIDRLVAELKEKNRPVTDLEDAMLLWRENEARNGYTKALTDLVEAQNVGSAIDQTVATKAESDARDKLREITDVTKRVGTEQGRGLAARRMMVKEDFSLANMILQAEAAKAEPLTAQEKNAIADMRDRVAAAQAAFDGLDQAAVAKSLRNGRLPTELVALEKTKSEFRRMVEGFKSANRGPGQKLSDLLIKIRQNWVISSPTTMGKIIAASAERVGIAPLEEAAGAVLSRLPGLAKIAAIAPREGSGLNLRAEKLALMDSLSKGLKDAWENLKTGQSEMDAVFGDKKDTPREWLDLQFGLHAAAKAPAVRAEFTRSFLKRVDAATAAGQDPTKPANMLRIAGEAYRDSQAAKFQQVNWLVEAWKKMVGSLEGSENANANVAGFTAKMLMPIVRIPTNLAMEVGTYAFGTATGSMAAGRALAKGIENLKPAQAEAIMRQFKKGSLGAAALALGYFNPQMFGGYYSGKRDDQDVKAGAMRIGSFQVPSWVMHNPLLEVFQLGATIRRASDKVYKGNEQGGAVGVGQGLAGWIEEFPFGRQITETAKMFDTNPQVRGHAFGQVAKSLAVPQFFQWLAGKMDTDSRGEPQRRKPETTWDHIKTGIPGLRQTVPAGR